MADLRFSRRASLGLLASAALIRPARAAARLSYDLRPQAVAKGVWMIEGSTEYFTMENGGAIVNCALLQGDTGLIVVDTGSSLRYGEALKSVADGLDLRGVSTVINTHHHPDHFFGNQVFADRPILALGETILQADAQADALADNMYRILGDWMRGTDPVIPRNVISGGDVVIDGRAFLALPLSGHTEGDLALLDRESGILIAGDLVFYDRAATTPSADLPVWHAALDTLEGTGAAAVLPGHGPIDRSGAAIPQTRAYLRWLEDTLRTAAGQGLDMIEVMDLPLPPEFAGLGAEPEEFHRSIAHLYPSIEREVMPRAN
ncbi:beta-lactamase domain protein (plasmid) [Dinoroseobacter shibae DFL 12 = DSM 16493]|jgi:quinoprotein relay system zinc metallohydrolase 1|uniref:Beta-lactamase domain protein n=1 Tax=Dinoroseobacter shibae (strain DSM 16493 / NCIMB 14021 / DFL 12) TaxID=398580 RepID=A8LUE7_DINSH|nr:quinoprotein relay system zinc metallohydrolase 1 [Dinoroseobacter shibae]ABV95864.1 beta-lactamase domain protein [Dinoroseobacter shibae DFL 12 = DSM 16493]URF49179.1 quinoprotein relay system zinc metallohydrolase 1 [Dinoroseobacter shibae]URF53487.1 quinoprotein relay system zinc metallohydrolase 1 [Dinoroseobacter shibae]